MRAIQYNDLKHLEIRTARFIPIHLNDLKGNYQWKLLCKQSNNTYCTYAQGIAQNIGNEMMKSYKKKQFRRKIRRIQKHQRQSMMGDTEILHRTSDISKDSEMNSININNKTAYIKRIICVFWYFVEVLYIALNYSDINKALIISCTVCPLVLYYQLLLDQCKVKLYDYLTDWNIYGPFRGPLLIKALMGIWMIMGIVFSAQLFIFRYIDIYKARKELMKSHDENFKNPIWNFFHNPHAEETKKMLEFTYPFCNIEQQRNEVLDTTFLTMIVYSRNVSIVKNAMQIYFGGDEWQYVDGVLDVAPVFMHIKNNETKQDIIVCRGTSEIRDIYEDFSLYSESLAITGFSKVVPIIELWPQSLLQKLIAIMSITEGIIFKDAKNRHFKAVYQYISNKELDLNPYKREINRDKPLIIAGHSLGGSTAHIVGAKLLYDNAQLLNIKSYGISNPGLVWNSEKFGIKLHLLSQIAVSIQPRLDPIPRFDEHTGTVHHIDCQSPYQEGCHYAEQSFCEMYTSCTPINEFKRLSNKQQLLLQCICDAILPFDVCVDQSMKLN